MKKLQNCVVENCIPTPASCVHWNGGDIEYLGICNGDPLTTLMWEVVTKLQEIAGEDLSSFDIDSLTEICNQAAPQEISLINILNAVKNGMVCLKDFIDKLSEQLAELTNQSQVNVNLKCYATFDNLGNSLSITRDQLDQLVIDELCDHEGRITGLEGSVINLQNQINNLSNDSTVEELNISTCIDPIEKPTSSQVISVANELCDLENSLGTAPDIDSALAQTPATDNSRYGLLPGWILVPANMAENYNNLLIKITKLETDLIFMQDNCCALTCDDIKLGFSAVFNEDNDGVIISFTWGAGTSIPPGFTDQGSIGTITDVNGNSIDFAIVISNNSSVEIPITGLNLTDDLTISITAKLGTDGLTCQKCLTKKISPSACGFCTITNTGSEGTVIIVFTSGNTVVGNNLTILDSTTTTTTIGS